MKFEKIERGQTIKLFVQNRKKDIENLLNTQHVVFFIVFF